MFSRGPKLSDSSQGRDVAPAADVYLVDADEELRRALGALFDTAGLNTRGFGSALEFLAVAGDLPISCVVTSVRMPGMDGIELVRELKRRGLTHAVIVLTGYGYVSMAVSAMKAGATDFIERPFNDAVLLGAVRAALDAEPCPDDVARARWEELAASLSPRETEVLRGVVDGKSNKVIARELDISPRTVEAHRASLMSKTGAGSLSGLVRIALKAGI